MIPLCCVLARLYVMLGLLTVQWIANGIVWNMISFCGTVHGAKAMIREVTQPTNIMSWLAIILLVPGYGNHNGLVN